MKIIFDTVAAILILSVAISVAGANEPDLKAEVLNQPLVVNAIQVLKSEYDNRCLTKFIQIEQTVGGHVKATIPCVGNARPPMSPTSSGTDCVESDARHTIAVVLFFSANRAFVDSISIQRESCDERPIGGI